MAQKSFQQYKYKRYDINMSVKDYVNTNLYIKYNCSDRFGYALDAFSNETYPIVEQPDGPGNKKTSKFTDSLINQLIRQCSNKQEKYDTDYYSACQII